MHYAPEVLLSTHSDVEWRTFIFPLLYSDCRKVFPLLHAQSVKFCKDRQVSSPPQDRLKSNIWLDYKVTPHIFVWSTQQSDAVRGLSGVFTGTLMDDVPRHDLRLHRALRANDLHLSALKVNISICRWYRHRQAHRRPNVLAWSQSPKWEAGKRPEDVSVSFVPQNHFL